MLPTSTPRGRYVDQWSYRDDRWAIDHRNYITDHSVTLSNSDPAPHDPRSIRGPEDPSVVLFG